MPSYESVKDVFNVAQTGSQHREILFEALDKLADSTSTPDKFLQEFIHNVKYCLIVFQKEAAVERTIDFIAIYATRQAKSQRLHQNASYAEYSDDEDDGDIDKDSFLSKIIDFLLNVLEAQAKAVRFRACQLVSKIMQNLNEETTINGNLADRIVEAMMTRLMDKIPNVRVQAVCALSRLQDPTDPKCPVIGVFLYMMQSDVSADVRKTALQNIAVTKQTLSYIIERTRDVKDGVRKYAFVVLGERVGVKSLSIAQRIKLLHDGLSDRVPSVKQTCYSKLVLKWVKACDDNILQFIALLDVENAEKTVEMAVKELLKANTNEGLLFHVKTLKDTEDEGQTIPLVKLDCDRVFYWRCLAEHCVSLGVDGQDALKQILPEISEFCQYIQSYTDKCFLRNDIESDLHEVFIMQQLLTIAAHMDLSDEVGRKNLSKLIQEMMINPSLPTSLIPLLHERYTNVEPDENVRIAQVAEVIADIKEPISVVATPQINEDNRARELKIAGIRVKLNQLRDELESCVSAEEFDKAAGLKNEITKLEQEKCDLENEANSVNNFQTRIEKDDPETLFKCLTIASGMLQNVYKNDLNPTLRTIVETLILPGVQNEEPMVRRVAIECLGLCSLLSRDFARRYLVLFLQVVLLDAEEVQIAALKSILDLLHLYGLETFKVSPAEQAFLEAEESILEPGNNTENDVDDDDVTSDDLTDNTDDVREDDVVDDHVSDDVTDVAESEKRMMDEAKKSVSSVFAVLIKLLENENPVIRNIAAEGFAKLLFAGRVHSPKLFSRLLLLWYNPMTEGDVYLRDSIGVFLPAFAYECRANQEQIAEAFVPTLRTLFVAPTSSPLAQIDVSNVADLLVQLTSDKHIADKNQLQNEDSIQQTGSGNIHAALALKIANEIISEPYAAGVRVLCKSLMQLHLQNAKKSDLKDLLVLHEAMIKEIQDHYSRQYLEKFHQSLIKLTETDTITGPGQIIASSETDSAGESEYD